MIKSIIKKLIPKNWLLFYHKILALIASFLYQHPSEKMVVIGVTGTAGKTTTVYLIGKILEETGYKVGWTNSISFKIGDREIENKAKMTMPGRFFMQKILKEMVKASCQYAILETSSEGILQSRHLGINYDIAVFTNLSPEHIEAHGGFETYKKTKAKLFAKLKNEKRKIVKDKKTKKTIIANLDDEHAKYFLSFPADEYYGYSITNEESRIRNKAIQIIKAENVANSSFIIHHSLFRLHLPGKFNVYNALAAISVARSLGIPLEIAKKALEKIKDIPGRMEEVISRPFKVIVDYAHTPQSLKEAYETLRISNFQFPISKSPPGRDPAVAGQMPNSKIQNPKMICVLGSCGGGRDKWKRPELGKLAAQYCNQIILTDEDPYDENPAAILNEIEAGFSQITNYQLPITNYEKIFDRREAIKKALFLAKPNDIVIITGKGCEPWMCLKNGRRIPWDDRQIAKDEFKKIFTP